MMPLLRFVVYTLAWALLVYCVGWLIIEHRRVTIAHSTPVAIEPNRVLNSAGEDSIRVVPRRWYRPTDPMCVNCMPANLLAPTPCESLVVHLRKDCNR